MPEFGDLYLTEISRKAIDAFLADWLAGGPAYQERVRLARDLEAKSAKAEGRDPRPVRLGRSPGTISNAMTPFREMLGHAVEWEYLTANPAIGVKRPKVERRGEDDDVDEHDEIRVLEPEQVRKLLAAARSRSHETYTLLLSAVTTGMRRGELLGLRWGDVDLEAGRVRVVRSLSRYGTLEPTKTKRSKRTIGVSATLAKALREHRLASPFSAGGDFVFCTAAGTPLDGTNMV